MIKIVILDIDGVLTDGKITVDCSGKEYKTLDIKDIDAVFEFKRRGVLIGMITGEKTPITEFFNKRFEPDFFYNGCKNKPEALRDILEQTNLSGEEVCYVGDGKYDVDILKLVKIAACPANAIPEVKKIANLQLALSGGDGCIWELLERIQFEVEDINEKENTDYKFERWLEEQLSLRVNYLEDIAGIIEKFEYVVFYGCGNNFDSIVNLWDKYIGRKIDYCSDSNPDKWGKKFSGIECLGLDELIAKKDSTAVFVTCFNWFEVKSSLAKYSFPFVREISALDLINASEIEKIDSNSQKDILSTYSILEDKISKEIFKSQLKYQFNPIKHYDIMCKHCSNDQYFPKDLITLSDSEYIVDAGAFTGDTLEVFLKKCNDKFSHYYAIELSDINFTKLSAYITDKLPFDVEKKLTAINIGLWHKHANISYEPLGACSAIESDIDGICKGEVDMLDNILKGNKVSFIKMDIEGAEINALKGAKDIIQKNLPKLAISVYHNISDLWQIPLFIKSIDSRYQIFLRHHTEYRYETVCYAIINN